MRGGARQVGTAGNCWKLLGVRWESAASFAGECFSDKVVFSDKAVFITVFW